MRSEPKQLTAWSYSRWRDYLDCPLKCKLKHIDHLPDPKGPAVARGVEIHKQAEEYIGGSRSENPFTEFGPFAKMLDQLKKRKNVQPELQLTFTNGWDLTEWRAQDAWLRMAFDAIYVTKNGTEAVIIDYKTGNKIEKYRENNKPQLGLYALGTFKALPRVVKVTTQFWYLDVGNLVDQRVFTRMSDESGLTIAWLQRVEAMMADTIFPARPSPDACRFCPFSRAKGGPCKF